MSPLVGDRFRAPLSGPVVAVADNALCQRHLDASTAQVAKSAARRDATRATCADCDKPFGAEVKRDSYCPGCCTSCEVPF